MSRPTGQELTDKLFQIATRVRSIHRFPEVLSPSGPERPLAESELFREPSRRRILELGSGWGEFLTEWLRRHPEDDYVAFEIKSDRIKKTVKRVRRLEPPAHLRIVPVNFNWFLNTILPQAAFDLLIVNYPDPWPKRRHWKHRLVQPGFPERAAALLRSGGQLHLATDYGPYARRMLHLLRNSPLFEPVYPWPHYLRERPPESPATRFEVLTEDATPPYYARWRLAGGEA